MSFTYLKHNFILFHTAECRLKTTCTLKNTYTAALDQSSGNSVKFRQSNNLISDFLNHPCQN